MAKHIHKCIKCSTYTLKEKCPKCAQNTIMPKPPKYSPEDKYSSFRRETKKAKLHEEGLL